MAVPVPNSRNPLGHLYEGLAGGSDEVIEGWRASGGARPSAPRFLPGWLGAPPMVGQIGESLMKAPVFEEFFEGLRDGIRREMEQMGLLQEHVGKNWDQMIEAQKEALEQTRVAADEIASLREAPLERMQTVRAINDMNLADAVKERAISFMDAMGAFGAESQRQAIEAEVIRRRETDARDEDEATERVKEKLGAVLRVLGVTRETIEGARREDAADPTPAAAPAAAPAEASPAPAPAKSAPDRRAERQAEEPYEDVVESGSVTPGSAPDPGDLPEGAAASARKERQSGAPTNADEKPAPSPWDLVPPSFGGGMKQGADWGSWREAATAAVGNRVNQWASEWGDINRPTRVRMPDGTTQWRDAAAGAAYEASMARIGRIQGAISDYGKNGGLAGAIGTAAPMIGRTLGVAGLAVGAGQMVTGALESQREANMPYTSTYGEGQMDAYGQRLSQWGFANLDMAGTMGAKRATDLYQGVAELALTGDEREEALAFGVSNYRRFGMDIQQSMAFIEMATKNGIESLDSYRVGLEAVAETAKVSGQSIKEAQENFLATTRELQGFTSGSATGQTATILTGIQEARGNTPLESLDYTSAIQDTSLIRQYAMRTGQDYDEVYGNIITGDQSTTTGFLGSMEETFVQRATQGRQPSASTQALIREYGPNATVDQVNEIIQGLIADQVFTPDYLPRIAQSVFGPSAPRDPAALMSLIAHSYLDSPLADVGTLGSDVAERAAAVQPEVDGLRERHTFSPTDFRDLFAARDERRQEWGLATPDEERSRFWGTRFGNNVVDNADPIYKATDEYFRMIGDREIDGSANLESVFSHIGGLAKEDMGAARDWASKQFVTTDAEGKEVTFGMRDLPRHIDQLEAGNVRVLNEDGTRTALQDVVGFTPEAIRDAQMRQQTVKVEIEAKGPLADILTVNQVGGPEVERGRATGTPASPFSLRVPGGLFGGN